jgi:tetratricopeptide (TPR) repeat protein
MAIAACDRPDLEDCRTAIAERRWEDGVRICGRVDRDRSDPLAASQQMIGLFALRRHDETLAVAGRLAGTAEEAAALRMAARIHETRNRPEEARRAFQRALELAIRAGRRKEASVAAHGLYRIATWGSRYREALDALGIVEREGRLAGDRAQTHLAHISLAGLLLDIGDLPGARRALEEARRSLPEGDDKAAAWFNLRVGLLELDEGNLRASRLAHEAAFRHARAAELPNHAMSAQLTLAEIALREGSVEAAAAALAAVPPWKGGQPPIALQAEQIGLRGRIALARKDHAGAQEQFANALALGPQPELAWRLAMWRGKAAEALGRTEQAEAAYLEAIGRVEEMRADLQIDELRSWFLSGERKPHAPLVDLYVRTGRLTQALATVDRAQARTFADTFFSSASSATAAGQPGSATEAADRADLTRKYLPALRASPVSKPRPVQELLRALRDENVLLFEEDNERVLLLSLLRGRIRIRLLEGGTGRLRGLVSRHRGNLDDAAAAAKLGSLLPSELLPPVGEPFYIVPSEAVSAIAFAAFRRNGRFLIEDHDIAQVPSLTALALMKEAAATGAGRRSSPVVLANPGGDLASAESEARQVAALLGVAPSLGSAATSARLRSAVDASVLHLAVHSGVGATGAWLGLADGRFKAADLVDWRLRPRLAVLASCASGATRQPGLWGSLATSLLVGGTQSVVASLQSIDDQQTRAFISAFYAHGGAEDPLRALARTQRSWARSGRPPSTWAAFVLYGIGRAAPAVASELSPPAKEQR